MTTQPLAFEASETAHLRGFGALRSALVAYRPGTLTWVVGLIMFGSLATVSITAFLDGSGPVAYVLSITVSLLAILGFVLGMVTSRPMHAPRLIDVAMGLLAAGATQFMCREMGMPMLIAASSVAVLVGIANLPGMPLDVLAAGSAYTGVVAGMVGANITLPPAAILAAGAAAGALFSFIGPCVMPGVGARMGTAGFIAGSAIYLLADALGAERPAIIPPPSQGVPHWGIVPIGMAGALITWILVNRAGTPFVLASGATSVLVTAGTFLFLDPRLATVLGVAWMGGTFVGGSASNRLPTAFWIGVAALLYGGLMLHFEGPLDGHAGIIGATGTIACLATVGIEWLLHTGGAMRQLARVDARVGSR